MTDPLLSPRQAKKAEQFLRDLLPQMNSYHDHKENLAHAAMAVLAGLVGSILVMDDWPPVWLDYSYFCPKAIAAIVFFILWLLIHVYMRWQLRQRRSAAIMYNAAIHRLSEWVGRKPTPDDFKPYNPAPSKRSWFYLDHLWVVPKGILIADNAKYYPDWLMFLFQQERDKMQGIPAEKILTSASIFLGVLVLVRTWCFK
jgi:hypothetical protein